MSGPGIPVLQGGEDVNGGPSGTVPLMSWGVCPRSVEQVGQHAARGWRLMPIPPMPEMKAMLGQVQMTGVVLYDIERETRGAWPDGAARPGRGTHRRYGPRPAGEHRSSRGFLVRGRRR